MDSDTTSIVAQHGQKPIATIDELKRLIRKLLEVDNICFLFGAGASKDAGGKTMPNLATEIIPELKKCFSKSEMFFSELQNSCTDPVNNNIDLEKLASYLVSLQHCSSIEDNNLVLSFSKSRSKDKVLRSQIDMALQIFRKSVFTNCSLPTQNKMFALDTHKLFLKKALAHRRMNQSRVALFTTNYDLLIEKACDELGVTYFNGFHGTFERIFYPEVFDLDIHRVEIGQRKNSYYYDKVIQLYKLHGSLTWTGEADPQNPFHIKEQSYDDIKRQVDSDSNVPPIMIYPTSNKYGESTGFPYSEMLRRFSSFLTRSQVVLFTVGYGFNDEHVNAIIRQGLSQPSLTMVCCLPEMKKDGDSIKIDVPESHFTKKIQSTGDARIIFIGDDAAYWSNFVRNILPEIDDEDPLDQIRRTLDKTGK